MYLIRPARILRNNNNEFTQYEYKDVATKLSITPHINQSDVLRLEIRDGSNATKAGLVDRPADHV